MLEKLVPSYELHVVTMVGGEDDPPAKTAAVFVAPKPLNPPSVAG